MAGEACLSHSQPRGVNQEEMVAGEQQQQDEWCRAWFIFLPRQRAAHWWLWWIGMLLTHTRPHMSHTLRLSHNNSRVVARTWTRIHKLVEGYTHDHTQAALSNQIWYPMWNVYDPPTRPSSLVNKLIPEVCVMHYHVDGCIGGLLLHPPSQAYPCAPYCTMRHIVKNIWLLSCVMINLCINTILWPNHIVICHISTDRMRGHTVPATGD